MEHSLQLKGVGKYFGSFRALEEINLELNKGEFMTMLGPSGSGKTTTLRIIAGFLDADQGRVMIGGRNVSDIPTHKRNIGMVFQDYALFPHMTVAGNVAYPLEARGIAKDARARRVSEMLEVVGLAKFAHRYPKDLSGGQQQRVALARALVFEPEIVLLDEPLAALDKKLRTTMQLEIMRITRQVGATVVSVTHDQEEALIMSDRIALFSHGKLVQVGTPRELYEMPANEFVADFIGESNILRGDVRRRGGHMTVHGLGWRAMVPDTSQHHIQSPAIMVRPEKMRLESSLAFDQNENFLKMTVKDVVYVGSGMKVLGQTEDCLPIQIWVQNHQLADPSLVGQEIAAVWDAKDCIVIAP